MNIDNPVTKKSVWTLVEYYVSRTKFIDSIDNLSMITILFNGFDTVSKLDSISIEEVYEALEPKLLHILDEEFGCQNDNKIEELQCKNKQSLRD